MEKEKLSRKWRKEKRYFGLKEKAKYDKGTKNGVRKSMCKQNHSKLEYDYTPAFRFLISKVGSKWDDVYSELLKRIDRPDLFKSHYLKAIFSERDYFMANENCFYSTLVVDENGILQLKNPNLTINDFEANCSCCTHTFNGKKITKIWKSSTEK